MIILDYKRIVLIYINEDFLSEIYLSVVKEYGLQEIEELYDV